MNKEELRKLFPITEKCIYLNHAGTGPLSSRARGIIDDCLRVYQQQANFNMEEYWRRLHSARLSIARLLGVQFDEIAFTSNTSEGIFIGLSNLPIKDGDKIIVMDEVFPAVRYVVDNNFPEIDRVYAGFTGKSGIEAVKEHLDGRVRVVVIDHVQYLSGEMVDVTELGKFLHEHGVYLVVDGIQAIGVVECDLSHVDVLACGASKWLLSPDGTGFVYLNRKIWKDLKSVHAGWLGAQWRDFYNCDRLPPMYGDARKYEIGTRNIIGIFAMAENADFIMEYGIENIHGEIIKLKSRLREGIREAGCKVTTPENGLQSGILTIQHPDAEIIYRRMYEDKIMVSLRSGYLRFSPHFYNTFEEIDRATSWINGRS